MNMMRKPDNQRGPQLARSAKATAGGMRGRAVRPVAGADEPGPRASLISPWLASTCGGSRIARIVATTKSTKA